MFDATVPCPGIALTGLSLPDLAPLWRRTIFEVRALRPLGFSHIASLPHRLRGAFGHALLRMEGNDAAQAREALFGEAPEWRPGVELPKPFLIQCDEQGEQLLLRLVLFGIADRWRNVVFDAFSLAVEHGISVDDRPGAPRRSITIADASWTRREGVRSVAAGLSVRLRFITPLQLGPRHTLGLRYADVLVSIADRASGLARWQGFHVEPKLGYWREIAKSLEFRDDGLQPVAWERRSGAQGGRAIPMAGLIGHLDIIRPPEVIMPMLALGETTHVGGGTALGMGRFEML